MNTTKDTCISNGVVRDINLNCLHNIIYDLQDIYIKFDTSSTVKDFAYIKDIFKSIIRMTHFVLEKVYKITNFIIC